MMDFVIREPVANGREQRLLKTLRWTWPALSEIRVRPSGALWMVSFPPSSCCPIGP